MVIKSFRKEITPKRVYSMLKTIEFKGKIKEENLIKIIQPSIINKDQLEVKKVLKFLFDLNMVKKDLDEFIIINIENDLIKDEKKFSDLMYDILIIDKVNDEFYDVTEWIMKNYNSVIIEKGAERLAVSMREFGNVDEEYILTWRFWARFIGLGYIYDTEFIPNPMLRIERIIRNNGIFKSNRIYTMKEFLDNLIRECPILGKTISNNQINETLSLALNSLNENKVIKLDYIQDSLDIWNLVYSNVQLLNNITHVKIGDK